MCAAAILVECKFSGKETCCPVRDLTCPSNNGWQCADPHATCPPCPPCPPCNRSPIGTMAYSRIPLAKPWPLLCALSLIRWPRDLSRVERTSRQKDYKTPYGVCQKNQGVLNVSREFLCISCTKTCWNSHNVRSEAHMALAISHTSATSKRPNKCCMAIQQVVKQQFRP